MVVAGTPGRFVGYWRIIDMELWDADYLDLVVPAFLKFDCEQMGQFQFGTVRGWLDCRFNERDDVPAVDFSWEGENDNDPGCGRGWPSCMNERASNRCRTTGSSGPASPAAHPGRWADYCARLRWLKDPSVTKAG